jgi:heme/copper-type cytochrome/quinol oxidase subunit 4
MVDTTQYLHLVVLVAAVTLTVVVVWAIARTVSQPAEPLVSKVAWCIMLLVPVVGIALWLAFFWRRRRPTRS